MTKDKPIGLLVGMIFIIAFGLILSEVTGKYSPQPTPVAAEENIAAYAPSVIEDSSPIGLPTRPREALASAGGGIGPGEPPRVAVGGGAVIESALTPPPGRAERTGTVETELRPGTAELAAMGTALRNTLMGLPPATGGGVAPPAGLGVVPVAPGPAHGVAPGPGPAPAPAAKPATYKVEPGDSLIKIARKVYGADNWRMYKQIFEANRKAMDDDETALTVGQELLLPPRPADKPGAAVPTGAPGGAAAIAAMAEAGRSAGAGGAVTDGRAPAGGTPPRYTEMALTDLGRRFGTAVDPTPGGRAPRAYVVQRGDTLSVIARKVLNDDSPAAVRKIYNANKNRLPGPNRLSVGMQLQIPS